MPPARYYPSGPVRKTNPDPVSGPANRVLNRVKAPLLGPGGPELGNAHALHPTNG